MIYSQQFARKMNKCDLTMQETQFLIALLENGTASKQTCLQLLAAEHLYIPTLLPKLKTYAKQLKQSELAQLESDGGEEDDYCRDREFPEEQSLREYDA
jgi:hypothetical protein